MAPTKQITFKLGWKHWLSAYAVIWFLSFGFYWNTLPDSMDSRFTTHCYVDKEWTAKSGIREKDGGAYDNTLWCNAQRSSQIGGSMVMATLWPVLIPFKVAIWVTSWA